MEWIRFTISRLSAFLFAIVPGAAVLTVLGLHHPDWAAQVRDIGYLGYRTKACLILAAGFVAGWTVTFAFSTFLGGINGFVWGVLGEWLWSVEPQAKPWHNPNWRSLLISFLGNAAPENVAPIYDASLQLQIANANQYPEPQRSKMIAEANLNKSRADVNDFEWKGWWRHLHHELIFKADPVERIALTLASNFQAASLVLLWAVSWTPLLRQWWLISACIFWLATCIFQTAYYMTKTRDPWSTFLDQLGYLRDEIKRPDNPEEEVTI